MCAQIKQGSLKTGIMLFQIVVVKTCEKLSICRLKHHFKHNKHHLLSLLNERVASCRPLFDIFDANRMLLCHHTISPLNGLWFSALLCLLFWNLATPLTLALANIHRRIGFASGLRHTNSHQYEYKRYFFFKGSPQLPNLQTSQLMRPKNLLRCYDA